MKLLLTLLCAVCLTTSAMAQTNSFLGGAKEMIAAIANSTNWNVVSGYGHSIKAQNNLTFEDVAYNVSDHVGLVVGLDQLWNPHTSINNTVKGGVTLQASVQPFNWLGATFLTNIVAQPFVADLVATPNSGSAVGNIVTTGINFDVYQFSRFELDAGVQYESRIGQGVFDGNYVLVHLGISRKF